MPPPPPAVVVWGGGMEPKSFVHMQETARRQTDRNKRINFWTRGPLFHSSCFILVFPRRNIMCVRTHHGRHSDTPATGTGLNWTRVRYCAAAAAAVAAGGRCRRVLRSASNVRAYYNNTARGSETRVCGGEFPTALTHPVGVRSRRFRSYRPFVAIPPKRPAAASIPIAHARCFLYCFG